MPTDTDLFGGTMMRPVVDPYAVHRRLRREHPVSCVEGLLGRAHLVTCDDDVRDILKNPSFSSSRANARGAGPVMGWTILERDGGEHLLVAARVLRLLAPSLLRAGMGRREPVPADGVEDARARARKRVHVGATRNPAEER